MVHKVVGPVGKCENAKVINKEVVSGEQLDRVWKAPRAGIWKLNSDAAKATCEYVGLGGAVRDRTGDVVVVVCAQERDDFMVDVVEAMPMRFLLKTVMEPGFAHLVVETDNMKLYSHLRKRYIEHYDFCSIVVDILKLASSCVVLQFRLLGGKVVVLHII